MVAKRDTDTTKDAVDSGDYLRAWDPSAGLEYEVGAMGIGIKGAAEAFADGDATPSVASGQVCYSTANTSATTITDFDGGFVGQTILVKLDTNTTVDFSSNSNLYGNGGSDFAAGNANDAVRCTLLGTAWYCTVIDAVTE